MTTQQMIDTIELAQHELALISNGHDNAYKALYDLEGIRMELLQKADVQ